MKESKLPKLPFILTFLVLVGTILMFSYLQNKYSFKKSFSDVTDNEIVAVTINDKDLNIEVVNSQRSITQGLSDREKIGSDGMIFVLPELRVATFWMKDMLIDLDMVWINDNKIVGYEKKVPKPEEGLNINELVIYSSDSVINMVLELNSGDIEKYGLEIGDELVLN